MVKRICLSVASGVSTIALLIFLTGLLMPYTNPDKGPVPLAVAAEYAVSTLLYWPSFHLFRGGRLDCPNADSIPEKFRCIGMSLSIDLLVYSAVCFLLLWVIGKRRQAVRASLSK